MKAWVAIVVDTGADAREHLDEGRRFAEVHGIPTHDVVVYDDIMLSKDQMRKAFYSDCEARAGQGYNLFALFGHGGNAGTAGGWIQLHFNQNKTSEGHVSNMAAALSYCMAPGAVVVLYSCLVAAGPDKAQTAWANNDPYWVTEGSFAQELSSELCTAGVPDNVVIGHTTSGHTTHNPMVLVIGDCGKWVDWYVTPYDSPEWPEWRDALKTDSDDLRFQYPLAYVTQGTAEPSTATYALIGALVISGLAWLAWFMFNRKR